MEQTVLREVYELLRRLGAVASESEFSKDWLGRSECYLRHLRFKGTGPSVGSVAICASKLQHYGQLMEHSERHAGLSGQFLALSEQCHRYINSESRREWMR